MVPHLVVEPTIEWTRQDGTVVNASSGIFLQLNFNPVMISDSSHYTCRASVNIDGIVFVSGEDSRNVLLDSEMISMFAVLCKRRNTTNFNIDSALDMQA